MRWIVRLTLAVVAMGVPMLSAGQAVSTLSADDTELALIDELVFAVGSIDGEEWQAYGTVDAVAFDRHGNLYVLDGQNARVVVLDPAGNHLRTFGGRGGGPGEFQMAGGLTVTADDRVVVYDMGRSAYSILELDGEYLSSVSTDMMSLGARPTGGGSPMGANVRAHPMGGFLVEYRGFDIDTGDPATSVENGAFLPVRRYATDGSAEGSELFRGVNPGPPATMVARPGEQALRMGAPPAFSPVFRWATLPGGGAAFIDGVGYEIHMVDDDGATLRTIRRPFEPRDVTSRDQREEKERRLEALEATGAGAPMRVEIQNGVRTTTRDEEMGRRLIEQTTFAEMMPVLADLTVDPEGRIWAQRTGARPGQPGPVDVVTSSGEYLGTVELDELPDTFASDGRAAWITVGDFGVMGVRVARLEVGGR